MIEISWLGRGGQGVVFASRLLVDALIYENKFAQSIIFFGAERRGAPVRAYNRISDEPIKYHHFVHKPDIAVVFSTELLGITNILDEIKEGGLLIINAPDLDAIRPYLKNKKKIRIGGCDATQIALDLQLEIAGLVIPNTAMLGAFAKLVGLPSIESITKAIKNKWSARPKIAEKNVEAAKRGYEAARIFLE